MVLICRKSKYEKMHFVSGFLIDSWIDMVNRNCKQCSRNNEEYCVSYLRWHQTLIVNDWRLKYDAIWQ